MFVWRHGGNPQFQSKPLIQTLPFKFPTDPERIGPEKSAIEVSSGRRESVQQNTINKKGKALIQISLTNGTDQRGAKTGNDELQLADLEIRAAGVGIRRSEEERADDEVAER